MAKMVNVDIMISNTVTTMMTKIIVFVLVLTIKIVFVNSGDNGTENGGSHVSYDDDGNNNDTVGVTIVD